MVLAVRNAAIDAERDREATEARYREEHSGTSHAADAPAPGGRDPRSQVALAVILAADARADAMLANHEAQVRAQRRLSDRLAFLVPPVLMNDVIVELAGNGPTRWDGYLERIGTFQARWQSFFVERASRGAALTSADYSLFPRFESSEAQAKGLDASAGRVSIELAWVGAVAMALLGCAARRLSRN
jgi:hypothetical protein